MEAGAAGSSSQISFLFEYEGSRRCLLASASVDEEPVEVQGTHIIQRWSEEFNCFVDVVSVIEIESGYKLTVTTCPKMPVS